MNKYDKCKHKISKKSFKNICKDKLDLLKIQLCRTGITKKLPEDIFTSLFNTCLTQ